MIGSKSLPHGAIGDAGLDYQSKELVPLGRSHTPDIGLGADLDKGAALCVFARRLRSGRGCRSSPPRPRSSCGRPPSPQLSAAALQTLGRVLAPQTLCLSQNQPRSDSASTIVVADLKGVVTADDLCDRGHTAIGHRDQ
jgi:hypothetical protein